MRPKPLALKTTPGERVARDIRLLKKSMIADGRDQAWKLPEAFSLIRTTAIGKADASVIRPRAPASACGDRR